MKYKVYSKETKLAVVNEYLVIKKLTINEIKTKYELSTPVLIYDWVKQYQSKGDQTFTKTSKDQTSHRLDNKDIEIKTLKQENEKLREKSLKDEVEKELLKKQLACEKSSKTTNIKNNLSCKTKTI